jgi:hypothetical protein
MAFTVPELGKRKNASNEKCRHSVLSWMGLLQLTGYDTCFYRAEISLDQSRCGCSHGEQFFIETADLVFPVDEVDLEDPMALLTLFIE